MLSFSTFFLFRSCLWCLFFVQFDCVGVRDLVYRSTAWIILLTGEWKRNPSKESFSCILLIYFLYCSVVYSMLSVWYGHFDCRQRLITNGESTNRVSRTNLGCLSFFLLSISVAVRSFDLVACVSQLCVLRRCQWVLYCARSKHMLASLNLCSSALHGSRKVEKIYVSFLLSFTIRM